MNLTKLKLFSNLIVIFPRLYILIRCWYFFNRMDVYRLRILFKTSIGLLNDKYTIWTQTLTEFLPIHMYSWNGVYTSICYFSSNFCKFYVIFCYFHCINFPSIFSVILQLTLIVRNHGSKSGEEYWKSVWPNTPMPKALSDLLISG
jgi:hypothetical protein